MSGASELPIDSEDEPLSVEAFIADSAKLKAQKVTVDRIIGKIASATEYADAGRSCPAGRTIGLRG
jgi:hypothetical protein